MSKRDTTEKVALTVIISSMAAMCVIMVYSIVQFTQTHPAEEWQPPVMTMLATAAALFILKNINKIFR